MSNLYIFFKWHLNFFSGNAKKLENSISMDHVPLAPVQGFSIDDSLLGDDTQV